MSGLTGCEFHIHTFDVLPVEAHPRPGLHGCYTFPFCIPKLPCECTGYQLGTVPVHLPSGTQGDIKM